ncbi:hypothetical protein [Ulvibacter antarcticus]|uniref:Putative glycosyltransferase n=1 Tax=Ulvibacter antarcticus TaxID=442714 RepID=A0A3L9YYY9_9FLAO|nr:hypothetical protein [Ulvibacter antarcticus]RMA64289.1 putative glycosyltransferase [Ulvibacter antarcticus]
MIAFYVQGGGLGHLTRTEKLIKTLHLEATNVVIISPSDFTRYFKQYQFVHLEWKDTPERWTEIVHNTLLEHSITQCYIDTFPFGLKGELISVYKSFPQISFYYVSRILKWEKYLSAMPRHFDPEFEATLLLETLYPEHLRWIEKHPNRIRKLRLDADTPLTDLKLSESPYVLVVHSGGVADVQKVLAAALSDLSEENTKQIIVCTQVAIEIDSPFIEVRNDIFPVAPYFRQAEKIYTAGGFNLMQELKPFRSKHIAIPLERLYDDQKFRILNQ